MFPKGYKHSDSKQTCWSMSLIDAAIGREQAVWSKDVMSFADFMEESGVLDDAILAALVSLPLYGTTRFARVDFNVQKLVSLFRDGGAAPDVPVGVFADRMLTSEVEPARMMLGAFLMHVLHRPMPDSINHELSWYHYAHKLVFIAGRMGEMPNSAADLLGPGLLRRMGAAMDYARDAIQDLDPDLVEDLHGLRTRLKSAGERLGNHAALQDDTDNPAAKKARIAAENAQNIVLQNKLQSAARRAPRL